MTDKLEPGIEALVYDPSTASWALAEAVARPPAFMARVGLYLVGIILATSFVYAYFAKLTIAVSGRGIVRTSGKIRPVRASATGKVARLLATNGLRVKRGAPLLEMEDNLDEAQLTRATSLIKAVRAALSDGDGRGAMAKFGALTQEPLRLTGPVLARERASLAEALNGFYQALRTLHESTPELTRADVSERQVAEEKIARIRGQHLETELRNELQDLERSVARLSVSIRDRQEQARRAVSSARTTLEVQIRIFEEGLRSQTEDLVVGAPADGIVSNVTVAGAGELIQSGQHVLDLIPEGGKLIAEIEIANKDIADLRLGMPVKLKLDAYPFQDFGTLAGTLAELPEDVAPGSDRAAAKNYVVTVAPASEALVSRGESKPIKLGMTLAADIEVRRRTLLQLAVIEVLKLKELF